jgi:hypothetical protein
VAQFLEGLQPLFVGGEQLEAVGHLKNAVGDLAPR